ncbi:MAG: hypothetical protein HY648_00835 [Acidobacteria bacterium]|nr:hypothetical protein [Acidobacteriota bacterium]
MAQGRLSAARISQTLIRPKALVAAPLLSRLGLQTHGTEGVPWLPHRPTRAWHVWATRTRQDYLVRLLTRAARISQTLIRPNALVAAPLLSRLGLQTHGTIISARFEKRNTTLTAEVCRMGYNVLTDRRGG